MKYIVFLLALWPMAVLAQAVTEIEIGVIDPKLVAVSPQGDHFAYVHVESPNKSWVVLDGKKQSEFYRIASTVHFSPDGKHLGYAAATGDTAWQLVLDNEAGPAYHSVFDHTMTFSADSSVAGYIA